MKRGSILIVEDEPAILDITSIILKRAEYPIHTATDGEEGFSVFKREREGISLILTDYQMPKMNGLRLAELARDLNPRLKVVIMSGYSPNPDIMKAIEEWGAHFIAKPFRLPELENVVRMAMMEASGQT